MSLRPQWRVLSSLLFAAAWLVPFGLLSSFNLSHRAHAMGPQLPGYPQPVQPDAGGMDLPFFDEPGEYIPRGRRVRSKSALQKKARRATGKTDSPAEKTDKAKKDVVPGKTTALSKDKDTENASGSDAISFKQDVAPILLANCVGCHSKGRPGLSRGKLEMTSFAKLMEGTPKEKVITPGKPEESHLILRVRGEETPRMPQGGNNNGLAEEAISRIEQWIKSGATLDAGLDPKAPMESYSYSPEQVQRNKLARMSAKDREQLLEATGRDRWKKTNPKLIPELTHSEHFVLFSNLPKDRAANTVKFMEAQHGQLKRLLGAQATNWVEKVSVYVFNSRKDFVELTRSVENREVDADVTSSGNLGVAQPYIAVLDPLGGKKEDPAALRRKPRAKKADEKEAGIPERSLAGLLASSLGEASVAAQGKSPRWLAYGMGAYLGAQAERGNPYYRKLRQLAHQEYDKGWFTPVNNVLGETDQVSAEELRSVGFAIVESLLAPDLRGSFPAFTKGMSQGKERLDDVLKEVYGITREDFLGTTGEWVAAQYGKGE
jgi:hypothetical protein